MIEKTQKQILFEEAARKGIQDSQLLQMPDILSKMLGVSDINTQKYGMPLAPLYTAKSGELVDVKKIGNFFTGIARDIKVSEVALTEIENELLLFNLEIWIRMQLLKNRSLELSKKARIEKLRAALGSTWVYTETFSNTRLLDMFQTTAWIDASEGIAFIPNSGDEKTVPMQEFSIVDGSVNSLLNYLGSNPKQAVDGLDSTNWRCLFLTQDWATATYKIAKASNITAVSVDPVGFGIELKIEVFSDNKFQEAVKAILYNKKTFPISFKGVSLVRVSYRSATASLPKTVGIREMVLYQTPSVRIGEIYTKELRPSEPFTEVRISTAGEIPQNTKVDTYVRTSTGAIWKKVTGQDWTSIVETDTTSLSIDYTSSVMGTSTEGFRGLYGQSIALGGIPVTDVEGKLEIGNGMVEVSAFKKDWVEDGDFPRILKLDDFNNFKTKRTWSSVPIRSFIENGSGTCLQLYGENSIQTDLALTRGGGAMIFQRKLDSNYFPLNISTYNQLCIVPLVGAVSSGMMQYDYNYKLSFKVFCSKAFSYQDARYWFYQGYRQASRRLYKDIGKSFGTFALYINQTLVASEEVGKTISTDHKIDNIPVSTIDDGGTFSLNLNAGWNQVDILINVYDPQKYGLDAFDVANQPFLQLSLYPSLFDHQLSNNINTQINKILATGIYKPVNEFDLLWNLPKEPTFWSWSDDRQFILFNTNELKTIDGYFKGLSPSSTLTYKAIQVTDIENLYVKVVLERTDNTDLSPVLNEFSVMVR